MPVFSALVLLVVLLVSIFVVAFAARERATLLKEMASFVSGIERRTEATFDAVSGESEDVSSEMKEFLDEAVQVESHKRAVLAVNELGARASLRRTRAHLLSRGLPRITLLSGGGGAFVIMAVGNFETTALLCAAASALIGLVGSFVCLGLNSSTRGHARKYVGMVDVLGREVERHFTGGNVRTDNLSLTGNVAGGDL